MLHSWVKHSSNLGLFGTNWQCSCAGITPDLSSHDNAEACCSWHHCEHEQLCLALNEQQSQCFCVREQQQQSSASTHLLEKQQDTAAPAGSSFFWQQCLVRFLPAVSAIWSEIWQGSQGWGFGGCWWGPLSTTERYGAEGDLHNLNSTWHLTAIARSGFQVAVLCHAVLCHAMLCHAMLCHAVLCHVRVLIDLYTDKQVHNDSLSI